MEDIINVALIVLIVLSVQAWWDTRKTMKRLKALIDAAESKQ